MLRKRDEALKAYQAEFLRVLHKTLFKDKKAVYLSIRDKSQISACLCEFVGVVYEHIQKA